MPAPPVQPIVIWFGRVGDLILLSALLEILHRRFGSPCHVIGAGAWLGETTPPPPMGPACRGRIRTPPGYSTPPGRARRRRRRAARAARGCAADPSRP